MSSYVELVTREKTSLSSAKVAKKYFFARGLQRASALQRVARMGVGAWVPDASGGAGGGKTTGSPEIFFLGEEE